MRRTVVPWLIALGLLAAHCSRTPSPDAPSPDAGRPGSVRVLVYEAVLRHLAGADLGGRWRHVYVASSICSDASRPVAAAGACPDALSASEQAELVGRLRDVPGDVRFVGDDEARRLTRGIFGGESKNDLPVRGAVLLRVGRIGDERGGRVSVPGSYFCGGLCAGGATWLLRPEGGGAWDVVGPKGQQWIS